MVKKCGKAGKTKYLCKQQGEIKTKHKLEVARKALHKAIVSEAKDDCKQKLTKPAK